MHAVWWHYSGARLATVSGDTTVKLWDFSKAECVQTFTEHTHAGKTRTSAHIYTDTCQLRAFCSLCIVSLYNIMMCVCWQCGAVAGTHVGTSWLLAPWITPPRYGTSTGHIQLYYYDLWMIVNCLQLACLGRLCLILHSLLWKYMWFKSYGRNECCNIMIACITSML